MTGRPRHDRPRLVLLANHWSAERPHWLDRALSLPCITVLHAVSALVGLSKWRRVACRCVRISLVA